MKLVIHIGQHKSGSTSIQDYCYANSEALIESKIYYPKDLFDKYPRQHSEFTSLLAEKKISELEKIMEGIVHDAKVCLCDTVFISGEDFSTIKNCSIKLFSLIIDKYFTQKNVILVLRNKKDFIYSSYKHHLRYGRAVIETKFKENISFSPKNCVKAWNSSFNGKISVLNFDRMKKDLLGCFFNDVFNLAVTDVVVKNQSLDYLTLIIYNTFIKQYKCRAIDEILWDISIKHSANEGYGIESKIASEINDQFPIEDWVSPEFSEMQYSLLENNSKTYHHDPIEVCERFIDLFSQLSEHFQSIKNNVDNEA